MRGCAALLLVHLASGLFVLREDSPVALERSEDLEDGLEASWAEASRPGEDTEALVRQKEAEFGALKARIRAWCEARPHFEAKKFRVALETRSNLAYCIHNKAGSSTILQHLYTLHGVTANWTKMWKGERMGLISPKKVGVRDVKTLNAYRRKKHTFTFSFVRHPFARIVSAYVNKIGGRQDPNWYPLADRLHGSWQEFVDYVLEDLRDGGATNNHWEPWTQHCHPCTMDFDFIGKLETFTEDMRYVLVAANLTSQHLGVEDVRHTSSQSVERSDGNRTAKYFAMLPEWQRQRIYDYYKDDFELFGYSPEPYL